MSKDKGYTPPTREELQAMAKLKGGQPYEIQEASSREASFLKNLNNAQDHFEWILANQAWLKLGFDSMADWWLARVKPIMRGLSMAPTPELAGQVVDQVRKDEESLPAAQRRRESELADLVDSTRDQVRDRSPRSSLGGIPPKEDLEKPPQDPEPEAPEVPDEDPFASWTFDERELHKRLVDGETIVVTLRGEHDSLIRWAEAEGLFQRVDRKTEWGNPFETPADGDRDTVINNFAGHFLPFKPSLLRKVSTLKGKALGCWCAPEPCHAEILADWAERDEVQP